MANHQIDKIKVDEVTYFAENDRKLYEVLTTVYLDNLKRKKLAGKYNRELSYKLLEYYYQNHIRPEFKKQMEYDPRLNPAERKAVGKYFGDLLYNDFLKNIEPLSKKTKKVTKAKKQQVQRKFKRFDGKD